VEGAGQAPLPPAGGLATLVIATVGLAGATGGIASVVVTGKQEVVVQIEVESQVE